VQISAAGSKPGDPFLFAYGQGIEDFGLLSRLMSDSQSREVLEVIWNTGPRSEKDKELMRYLLIRPIQQSVAIGDESLACRQVISRYVDDVRGGKRTAVPVSPGLTNIVRPSRFVRRKNEIVLVLSDPLIARYYVLAEFNVRAETCQIGWEKPLFAM
jgi:hypothetical protein